MKPFFGPIAFLTVALAVARVDSQCLGYNDNIQYHGPGTSQDVLNRGEAKFSFRLMDEMTRAIPSGNLIFSSYSIFHALMQLYFGAKGQTEHLLLNAFEMKGITEKPIVWQAYNADKHAVQARFANDPLIQFTSVDKLFFGKNVAIEPCMAQKLADLIELLDFAGNPEGQRSYINRWVEMITHNEIKDLLPPNSIVASTKLVIANAAYFKGIWQTMFPKENTRKRKFFAPNAAPKCIPMMEVTGRFKYAKSAVLGCELLELPYQVSNGTSPISMYLMLPNEGETDLSKLTWRLWANQSTILEEHAKMVSQQVNVRLPKINIEQSIELSPVLQRLGLGPAFAPGADYSGFSKTEKFEFNGALHKAVIRVDEEGTVAAAATAIVHFTSVQSFPKTFYCNRPFAFIICDSVSKAILFSGLYREGK